MSWNGRPTRNPTRTTKGLRTLREPAAAGGNHRGETVLRKIGPRLRGETPASRRRHPKHHSYREVKRQECTQTVPQCWLRGNVSALEHMNVREHVGKTSLRKPVTASKRHSHTAPHVPGERLCTSVSTWKRSSCMAEPLSLLTPRGLFERAQAAQKSKIELPEVTRETTKSVLLDAYQKGRKTAGRGRSHDGSSADSWPFTQLTDTTTPTNPQEAHSEAH